MIGARQTADAAKARVSEALAAGKRRVPGQAGRGPGGVIGVLALQRFAGNSAVSALMAAKAKSPGEHAIAEIDAAVTELRQNEPAIETVERGLKAAQAAGVPVELEGPKPPASALAVTMTGFGPASVAPKKAVPPPKAVPAFSPLGRAAAKPPRARGRGTTAPAAAGAIAGAGPALPATETAPLAADQLLQPPVAPTATRPEQDPSFARVVGDVHHFARDKRAHPPAAAKADEAQSAALGPADDLAGQAKAA
ncbi:MAG: hypothetical protein ABIR68_14665, partial [Ilumatobacteraceae bacterium]